MTKTNYDRVTFCGFGIDLLEVALVVVIWEGELGRGGEGEGGGVGWSDSNNIPCPRCIK